MKNEFNPHKPDGVVLRVQDIDGVAYKRKVGVFWRTASDKITVRLDEAVSAKSRRWLRT